MNHPLQHIPYHPLTKQEEEKRRKDRKFNTYLGMAIGAATGSGLHAGGSLSSGERTSFLNSVTSPSMLHGAALGGLAGYFLSKKQ
jgi:hypothetical protein